MVGARSSRGGDGPLGAGALRWTANGEAFGTGGTVTTALALGDYTVVLTATDSFGATNTDTALVHIVTNLPPACTIRSPDAGDVVITGTSVDFVATSSACFTQSRSAV